MKTFFAAVAFLLYLQMPAQPAISSNDWQSDLKFLQQTIHNDYPFLFKKTTPEDFDAAINELHKAIPEMESHEVLIGFAKIIAMFKYGHTRVGFREGPVPYHKLPINVYQFPDGIYITAAHKAYEEVVGAKISAIEGKPINEVLQAIYPVVPAENEQFFKAYGGIYLIIPEVLHAQGITANLKDQINVDLEKDGKEFTVSIKATSELDTPLEYGELKPGSNWIGARNRSNPPLYLKNLEKIYYYQYLPDKKAVYIRHSQIQDDPTENIPAFYRRVFEFIKKNDVEKLILDLRLNGGGNNYKNKPIVTGIIESTKINQKGKFFVIIGRRTFSACQNLVNELSNYTNAIFVGEPTGENINFYGDNRRVELPNSKLPVYLSFAWWQDKPQWENGPYTAPHLAVEMSYDDYRNNLDPVLDTALNFSNSEFIIDPMAYFTGLFMENKLDILESEAQRMVKDPVYRFFRFEEEFNKAGYNLLSSGQMEGALYVFNMNTKLFPDSANTWDSLAEANWKSGNIDKAKEYYNKAIRLDPKGGTADNARRMLIAIEKEQKNND